MDLHTRHISKALENMSELRICVKIEVAVLGSRSLISMTVSVDVKQHRNEKNLEKSVSGLELANQVCLADFGDADSLYGAAD